MSEGVLTGIFDQRGIQVDGFTSHLSQRTAFTGGSSCSYHYDLPCAAASVGKRLATPSLLWGVCVCVWSCCCSMSRSDVVGRHCRLLASAEGADWLARPRCTCESPTVPPRMRQVPVMKPLKLIRLYDCCCLHPALLGLHIATIVTTWQKQPLQQPHPARSLRSRSIGQCSCPCQP